MPLWTFTQVSQELGTSIQNITNRKAKLKNMGFIEKDIDGKEKLNENGFNYLLEQRKQTMQKQVNKFNNNVVNKQENIDNSAFDITKQPNYIIQLLEKQIEDLKKENEYWKKQFELKDQELKDKNNYIQEWNTKAFALLSTSEKKQEQQETRKGFWNKIFH